MDIVKFTVSEDGMSPFREHEGDAGWDLCAAEAASIPHGTLCPVKTGVRMEIPPGYFCDVRSKSGLAMKHSLCVLNSPGTIDSGYRGEIVVLLFNAHPSSDYKVKKGDKIAQLVFQALPQIVMKRVDALEASKDGRNEGGLGSTGYQQRAPAGREPGHSVYGWQTE